MKLIYTTEPFMQDTPAAVNRDTGIIYINPVLYATLTPFQQKFVLQHELGHYRLQTSSELKADAYAFAQLAGTEFRSLKQSLGCISEILGKDNPTRKRRYKALYKRVLAYDYLRYGNKLAKEEFERLYPGEGAIPLREIVAKVPDAARGIEVPHLARVQEMGYEAHARRALESAKDCLKDL